METEFTGLDEPAVGPDLEAGRVIDDYQVVRKIGQGGMGAVYLVRDQRLGRKAALKVVLPDRLGSSDAVQRFLLEARATARMNHPHIVTVYGAGEVDGCPYLSLEYLEGQSLRHRMDEAPLSLGEVLSIARDIAAAMAVAHERRILHRDLKPQNVVLPRDGRLRIVDFGLARLVTPAPVDGELDGDPRRLSDIPTGLEGLAMGHSEVCGTPPYMAPEQWAEEELSPATDVWAFGVMLFELLTGERPFSGSVVQLAFDVVSSAAVPSPADRVPDLPEDIVRLVTRCLDKAPANRPTFADLAEELRDHLVSGRGALRHASDSPYRGLLAFGPQHADIFHGREREVAEFLERLRHQALLPVVGPSGAGKSSFVLAGVVPALLQRGGWSVLSLRPGPQPLKALVHRLAEDAPSWMASGSGSLDDAPTRKWAGGPADDAALSPDEIAAHPALLGAQLREIAANQEGRLLLLVDQFEELYTLVDDPAVRDAFVEAVLLAADDPDGPVRVVMTVRDDFLGHVAGHPGLAAALGRGVTGLRCPAPEDLVAILTRPLERFGFRYEEGLVEEMVASVAAEPAGLPMLQFTAARLWRSRDRERSLLLRSHYEAIGGVTGALADHADGVIESMDPDQVRAARGILLRLSTTDGTRARLTRSEIEHEVGPRAPAVLDQLLEARLLSAHRVDPDDAPDGDTTSSAVAVELSHESLLTRWDRLRRWRGDAQTDLETLEQLRVATRTWDSRGRRAPDLWRGESLAEAIRWRRRFTEPLPERVADFLDTSVAEETRAVRLRRRAVASALTAALLVAVLAVLATVVISHKERQARVRMAQALLSDAWAAYGREDLFEARAKLRTALETHDMVGARALWWRLGEDPRFFVGRTTALVYAVDFSPDGRFLAASGSQGLIRIWDLATGRDFLLRDSGPENWLLEYSPDGARLATGQMGGDITLWDTAAGGPERVLRGHTHTATTGAFDSSGDVFMSVGEDHTLRWWDVADGGNSRTLAIGDTDPHPFHAISDDGEQVFTSMSDGSVRVWDTQAGEPVRDLVRPTGIHRMGALSPDGRWIATGSPAGEVLVWERETGTLFRSFWIPAMFKAAAFGPGSDRLIATFGDGTVAMWDVETGESVTHRGLHRDQVDEAEFSPDGSLVATASFDGDARVWKTDVLGEPRPPLHDDEIVGFAFSPDGRHLATGSWDQTVLIWDVATGASRLLGRHDLAVRGVAYSPDGTLLASASNDRTAVIWSVATGQRVHTLQGHVETVWGVAFSPDGRTLVTSGYDHTIRVWDVASGAALAVLGPYPDYFREVGYSPDGRTLAAATSGGSIRTWNAADLREGPVYSGPDGRLYYWSYSDDGALVATVDVDGKVWVWDARSGDVHLEFDLGQPGDAVQFLPGGRVLALGAQDGIIRLLDTDSGQVTRSLHAAIGTVQVLALSPDGRLLAATGTDHTVRFWDLETMDLLRLASTVDPGAGEMQQSLRDGGVAVGYADGTTDLRYPEDDGTTTRVLQGRLAQPVTALVEGPGGTLIVGHADGTLQVWDLASGVQYASKRLHGPVLLLDLDGSQLRAVSQVGDRLVLDLSPFDRPYCDVMGDVWASVPGAWEDEQVVERAPDGRHVCAD